MPPLIGSKLLILQKSKTKTFPQEFAESCSVIKKQIKLLTSGPKDYQNIFEAAVVVSFWGPLSWSNIPCT